MDAFFLPYLIYKRKKDSLENDDNTTLSSKIQKSIITVEAHIFVELKFR